MMRLPELRSALEKTPFEPFRIRLSSGDTYEVRNPGLVALMRSRLFITFPKTDRWTFVPFLHIAAIEALNGHGAKPRGRRPRS